MLDDLLTIFIIIPIGFVQEDDAKVSDQSSEQAENVRQSNSGDTSLDELVSTPLSSLQI